jgi:hypothetical protein
MAKKILVFSILFFFILGFVAWAAKEKPKNETVVSERGQRISVRIENLIVPEDNIVTKYLTSPMPELSLPATGDTAGYTYYEYQTNYSMIRQIANGTNNKRYFDWMFCLTANVTGGDRDVHFNSKVEGGPPSFGWLIAGGMATSSSDGRGGYCGLDILPDNREVLAYHNVGAGTQTTINVEKTTPGLGEFRIFDVPDSIPGSGGSRIWPRVAVQKDPTSPRYIHVGMQADVGNASGYSRCWEYFDSLKCQAPGSPVYVIHPDIVEPTSNYGYYVGEEAGITSGPITSPVSRKVAFVWDNYVIGGDDIYYVESTNGGDDWVAAGSFPAPTNVTNYGPGYTTTPTGEWAAAYDYNDDLHIIWTSNSTGYRRDVVLWHYSSGLPADKRVRQITSLSSASWVVGCSNWYSIGLMTLGVNYLAGPRHNWLYCLWTEYDGPPADTSLKGYTNSELYLAASSNGGLSWSQKINITNTHTNNCAAGACRAENWASIAERVDSIVHIQYIVDLDPGAFVNGEATGTKNPVRYLRYPESNIQIPAIAGLGLDPTVWNYPSLKTSNGTAVTDTLRLDNTGTATLYFKLDAPTATYVGLSITDDSIQEGGSTKKVVVTFNQAGPLSDTLVYDSIRVASNKGLLGGGATYVDTQWVKFALVVTSDSFYTEELDTIDTHAGGIKMVLSSAGKMGNGNDGSGVNGTYNGKDYLFDGSVALVTNYPGSNLGATQIYNHKDFLPEGHLQVAQQPEFATWGITTATATYAPMVHRIGTPYQWFWWWWTIEDKNVFFENERIMVKYTRLYRNPPPTWWRAVSEPAPLPTVYFGLAADIDAVGPSSCSNGSFANLGVYDQAKNLVYLKGDTVCNTSEYAGIYFYYSARDEGTTHDTVLTPYAAGVLQSSKSIHMNSNDGYPDDTLYKYMTTPGWFLPTDTVAHYEGNIVVTARKVDNGSGKVAVPSAPTLITAKYAFVMSDAGLAGLYKPMCGNANRDDKVTVSDVVYVVNYLFKGGPKPFMYYANANGDNKVTVSDVVYLVNYLFKGGAKPICNYPVPLP